MNEDLLLTPTTPDEHAKVLGDRNRALEADLGRIAPEGGGLVLEIGSGHGHFLTAYAAANPAALCIGVDLLEERIERANRKRDRARLSRLHFLHADARALLAVLPPHIILERIFVLFPDPWPKRRHHKNRIIEPRVLAALARHARPGAELCFRTDHEEYFAQAEGIIAAHPDWKIAPEKAWPFELETVFQARAAGYKSLIALRA